MIIWHSIATWICCLDPNKEYHDPFATDEVKKAKTKAKTAEVHVFGNEIEITENNKENINCNRIMNKNKRQLYTIRPQEIKWTLPFWWCSSYFLLNYYCKVVCKDFPFIFSICP